MLPPEDLRDEDLVYIDPETRTIVGKLPWDAEGNPQFLCPPSGEKRRSSKKKYAIATWRSAQRTYRLGRGGGGEEEGGTLEEVLPRVLRDEW